MATPPVTPPPVTPVEKVTGPTQYMGQTPAQLAETAGVTQANYMGAAAQMLGANPDTIVGQAVEKPTAIITSDKANDRAATNIDKLNKMTGNSKTGVSRAEAEKAWAANGGNSTGWSQNPDGTWSGPDTQKTDTGTKTDTTGTEIDQARYDSDPNYRLMVDTQKGADATLASTNAALDGLQGKMDTNTAAMIAGIKAQFEARKVEQKDINNRLLGAQNIAGQRSGRARYAPEMQSGIISDFETKALAKITELDQQETQAIQLAQSAADSKSFELLNKRIEAADAARKEKNGAIADLNKMMMQETQNKIAAAKDQREQGQIELQNQQKARDFAVEYGVTQPFYMIGNSLVDTGTGELVDLAAYQEGTGQKVGTPAASTDFSKIQTDFHKIDSTGNKLQFVPATGNQPGGFYDSTTGKFTPNGITSGGTGIPGEQSDPQLIAQAIVNGDQPPELTGLYGKGAAVRAELEKQGFNFTKANLDWQAVKKFTATMNGPQIVKLQSAARTAYDSLDIIDTLSGNLADKLHQSGVTTLNRANMLAAKDGLYGNDIKILATQLDNQISDVTAEIATVYRGGNAATSDALDTAKKQLNSDWDEKTLKANTDLARKNLRIRLNSYDNIGAFSVTGDNPAQNAQAKSQWEGLGYDIPYDEAVSKYGQDQVDSLLQGNSGDLTRAGTEPNGGAINFGSHLAKVNNNPGNLRFVGQAGASQGTGGFAKFSTPEAGIQALKNQIALDAKRGLTLAAFINKYAPPSENDTGTYITQMEKATGVSRNTPINKIDLNLLASAMAKKESSSTIG